MLMNKRSGFARRFQRSQSNPKIISWLNESRNQWKQKALSRQQELRSFGVTIRDLRKSREQWKMKAKENQKRIIELEEEIKLLQKKKSNITIEEKPKYHCF